MIDGVDELRAWREGVPAETTVGLVPTMGALHAGHAALIERAAADCDVTAVSIFVNPTQFAPGEDLDSYPRDREGDIATARAAGADVVWFGRTDALYPEGFATRVELPALADRLCGLSRPHHFGGVAVIVLKLLHLFRPRRAYFGEKDFQQSVLVDRMVRDLDLDVAIVPCPLVREEDGLALSSRNRHLSDRGRNRALSLSRALRAAADRYASGERSASALLLAAAHEIDDPAIALEYLELVDPHTLDRLDEVDPERGARLLVAATVERVRLIDNVALGGPGAP